MKIIDYKLIIEWRENEFEKDVKAALNKGWELYGSPTYGISGYNGQRYYAQAVVKYADESVDTIWGKL